MTQIPSTTDAKLGQQTVITSYYGLGGDASMISSIHIQWDASLIATDISVWATNFPEVQTNSTTAGEWVQLQPTSGYTAISPAGAGAVGASPLIVTVAGGAAGAAFMDLGNSGAARLRVRVVCTQAGQLRIRGNGKE